MASGVTVVRDDESLSLKTLELVMGQEFDGTVVKYGSIGPAAEDVYIDNRGNPTELNVATIASIHEHGKGPNLTRSFVGAWTDTHKREIGDAFKQGVGEQLSGKGSTRDTAEHLGAMAAEGIEKFIAEDNVRPELGDWWMFDPWRDPEGIPIYDTGQVAASMSFDVKTG